ncbi:MAG: ABC transporter substrate-binding protein [Oscillospiraceae bacterium]
MKRTAAFLLALILTLTLCACGGSDEPPEVMLKLGVFEPATGPDAAGGDRETLGIRYANSLTPTLTLGGVTYRVELVYADSGSTAEEAAAAADYLVGEGVAAVIGPYGSDAALAGGPVFEASGVPVIGASCTNPAVTEGNDYYFRICFTDDFQADVLAAFSREKLSAAKAYCLSESGSQFGRDLSAYFKSSFEAQGGTVITDSFPGGCTDFTAYLSRAVSEEADVIFLPVSAGSAAQILSQAAAMEIQAPFVGPDTLDDSRVLAATAGAELRLYVSTYYQEGSASAFEEGFRAYLNSDEELLAANGGTDAVSAVSVMGYDAYNTVLEAVKKAGSADKADILAVLPSVACTGVSGTIVFDENGDAARNAYIKAADPENGGWRQVGAQAGTR